jgi:hypothetical protein
MATFAENLQRVATRPDKGARLIARAFYRELRRGGYEDRDIMAIADEMLGCLTAHLRLYRQKKEVPVEGVEDFAPVAMVGMAASDGKVS